MIKGGWSPADPTNKNVQDSIKFALTESKRPYTSYSVFSASQQVVAGINYYFILDLTNEQSCQPYHFRVWDRFGKLSLTFNEPYTERSCQGIELNSFTFNF